MYSRPSQMSSSCVQDLDKQECLKHSSALNETFCTLLVDISSESFISLRISEHVTIFQLLPKIFSYQLLLAGKKIYIFTINFDRII